MYMVAIKNNDTGEVRLCKQDIGWNGEGSEFWWTEGNMACDCNRHNEFLRANGEEETDVECDMIRYSALYAELEDGTRIKLDD